jgi:hypothetical protein
LALSLVFPLCFCFDTSSFSGDTVFTTIENCDCGTKTCRKTIRPTDYLLSDTQRFEIFFFFLLVILLLLLFFFINIYF